MKMFLITCAYDENPPTTIGIVSAISEEAVCKQLGINPAEYFKKEPFEDGDTESAFSVPNTDWTVGIEEVSEITSLEQMFKECRFHNDVMTAMKEVAKDIPVR